jgi:hypothetical protein
LLLAGNLAGVGISSNYASDNPFVYAPGFMAEKWSGSLKKISAIGTNQTPVWDAGIILTGDPVAKPSIAPNPLPANRNIFTSKLQRMVFVFDFIYIVRKCLV